MIIEVKLYNETIGSVEWNDSRGCSVFQYRNEGFIRSIEPSPVLMPVQERLFETNRDHVKSFSFLMDRDGKWSISPAYDLTFQYKAGGTWTDIPEAEIKYINNKLRIDLS